MCRLAALARRAGEAPAQRVRQVASRCSAQPAAQPAAAEAQVCTQLYVYFSSLWGNRWIIKHFAYLATRNCQGKGVYTALSYLLTWFGSLSRNIALKAFCVYIGTAVVKAQVCTQLYIY